MKKVLCALLALLCTGQLTACGPAVPGSSVPSQPEGTNDGPLDTVALYAWWYDSAKGAFWKACGYNAVQLIDLGWNYNADTLLDGYIEDVAAQIDRAHADGFKVYILLMNNIEQYRGPADRGPDMGDLYDPADEAKTAERLGWLERNIKAWNKADGFSLMAADPGGVTEGMTGSGTGYYVEMAKKIRELVRRHAPQASFHVNTWAIAWCDTAFCDYAAVYDQPAYWNRMDEMANEVARAIADTDIGIELTAQDYYQRVTLSVFSRHYESKDRFPLYPKAQDVAFLLDGSRHVWAWPYYFVDTISTQVEIGTRYLYQYVNDMRALGVNGLVADWSETGYHYHALNTYAIARFCRDAAATPEQVIEEYAALIADGATYKKLAEVLKFIENNSVYQTYPIGEALLEPFETSVVNVTVAANLMKKVVPNPQSSPLLTRSPAEVCALITERLEQLKNA
ncbi:MAG: hypothetical protein IKI50_01550 [Clostridia bacterium]|nr:hypothetical protein [Clostridia bacterium]